MNIVAFKPNTLSALIQISNGKLYMDNSNIQQNHGEMVIYARECELNISNSGLLNNTGTTCILCSIKSLVHLSNVTTSGNSGKISVIYLLKSKTTVIDMKFSYNFGSLLITNSLLKLAGFNVFQNCNIITENTENLQTRGTLTTVQSTIEIFNTTHFLDNYSTKSGGAIHSTESKITIYNTTLISNNTAENCGGGAFLLMSLLNCNGNCTFLGNSAKYCGGGIHTVSSVVSLSNTKYHTIRYRYLSFIENRAELGGGIYFETNSKLNCIIDGADHQQIRFLRNKATNDGGAMFIKDETYPSTCNSTSSFIYSAKTECFFQVIYNEIIMRESYREHAISFVDNVATRGPVLYGGLLDRCSLCLMDEVHKESAHSAINYTLSGLEYFLHESSKNICRDDIRSDAVRVCHCEENGLIDCEINTEVHVLKGEIFNVSVIPIDQVHHTVRATIHTLLSVENVIGEAQQLQQTNGQCTNLTFNISSPHDSVDLVLYADQGPCDYKGLSPLTVKVSFKDCNCPVGFTRSSNLNTCKCNVHETLKVCVEAVKSNLLRRTTNCWINYISNGTGYMYLVHPQCPYDYCLPPEAGVINLSDQSGVDGQCNFNHAGLLCGQCRDGYSMSLGSSQCVKCPHHWPVVAFASILFGVISGIGLVALVLWLEITVAMGTFNGMLFYANIVVTSNRLFLPFSNLNFFTIFIHFLNNKLGVGRCFWEGMDVYGTVWFTYVFPLYIINLVIAIIIACKYSSRFSNIIGKRNPVATLATLIQVSYTYLLSNTIVILSFTVLQYPDGSREVVWLPDASVKYFQGKHIPLCLTAIATVIVGIIYTTLLFSWQWLQLTPNIRMLRWIRNTKLNLFMEAYHAPYKPSYRYWTGLLLFIRVVHSIAVTISADPKYVLLTTGILIAVIIIIKAYLSDSIYKNWVLDYLECTCYINLLLLILATFYSLGNDNCETPASISISVIFIMFICTLLYHIHYTLSRSISRYKRLCDFIAQLGKKAKRSKRPLDDSKSEVNDKNRNGCSSTEVALSNINEEESEETELRHGEHLFEFSGSNSLREPLL